MDKLNDLIARYRGEEHEDEMVGLLSALRVRREPRRRVDRHAAPRVPAVSDTSITCIPDWAIALAASANGKQKLEEFNKKYGRKIVWVPWQRPGFELALMLRKAVEANAGLRRHRARRPRTVHVGRDAAGGATSTASRPSIRWASSSRTTRSAPDGRSSAARRRRPRPNREALVDGDPAVSARRGVVEPARDRALRRRRGRDRVRQLAVGGGSLCQMGTSCPDHFLRTRISPLYRAVGRRRATASRRSRRGSPSGS